ncbi:MAG: hypothetical protein CM1200mP30_09840 [Pseudomonadota bacterium]|nr:MAG: hypothetical protein CM1200mP30_09840 [Pseudomonadota bacterium]
MAHQAQLPVEEADCVLFVVNAQEGWTHADEEIYRKLVEAAKPLFVVVNKADNQSLENETLEFYKFGLEQIFPVSSEHNRGIEGLLQEVNQKVPLQQKNLYPEKQRDNPETPVAVAVVGKPNAGKSSIVNALLRKGTNDC